MEIKEENKQSLKRLGAVSIACLVALVIALAIAFGVRGGTKDVSTSALSFALPMNNSVVVKDYADNRLQHNPSLKRWEIHLSVDLASEDSTVFSIYDGIVSKVDVNSVEGRIIKIEHEGGFVSVYSSLEDEVEVKEGDRVKKGQAIGKASTSGANESKSGAHLHFTLFKDGLEVDPNNYLDLQNK